MIISVLHKYKEIVSKLYKSFAQVHYPTKSTGSGAQKLQMTLSYQRLAQLEPFQSEQEFNMYLNKLAFPQRLTRLVDLEDVKPIQQVYFED